MSTSIEVELEPRSLAEWAKYLELPTGSLERWYYALKMTSPATVQKIRCALYYGRERCKYARGATRDRALQNLRKINLALEITTND
jgi:hypothetical protein